MGVSAAEVVIVPRCLFCPVQDVLLSSTKSPASVGLVERNHAKQALANHVAFEGVAALPGLPCKQTPDAQGSSHIHLVFPLQFSKWSDFLH